VPSPAAALPRRGRLGLVQQVIEPQRRLLLDEALGRRALVVAVPVVRRTNLRPRDWTAVRVRRRRRRRRERAPRRQQRLLMELRVRHHHALRPTKLPRTNSSSQTETQDSSKFNAKVARALRPIQVGGFKLKLSNELPTDQERAQ